MNIGFWFDYDQTYTFTLVFNELHKFNPDYSACGFVVNDRYFSYAEKNLLQYTSLIKFYDLLETCFKQKPSDQALQLFNYYDEKYYFAKIMYSNRHLNKLSYEKEKNALINLLSYFNSYIDKEGINVFIFNCVATSYSHLLYYVLLEKNKKIIIPTITGVNNRVFLADNPYEVFTDAYNYYEKLKSQIITTSDSIAQEALVIIQHIRQYNPSYENRAIEIEKKRYQLPSFRRIFTYLINYYQYYRKDYTQSSILQKIFSLFKVKWNKKISHKYFIKISDIQEKDFVYYPLHYEPEIATLILSQYNQLAIIDIIAKQLPLDWKLVIKEHPTMIGQRDPNFYKIIKKNYPNIMIIDPTENSQKLIHKSTILFSLCSTAILEAIILKKPVIYTGRVRYEGFGLGICSKDLLNFDKLIRQALTYSYEDDQILKMTISILKNSYNFVFVEPLGVPQMLEPENIEHLATAIYKKIKS